MKNNLNLNDIARALQKRFSAGPPNASFPQSLHVLPMPASASASAHPHLHALLPHIPRHNPSNQNHVMTIAISLAARPIAHLELIFPANANATFPPDLILTPIPHDPRLHMSLDVVADQLQAWHPDKAVDLIDAMARNVQAYLRTYHRASVERMVATQNERVAFDLATAATAGAVQGQVDAVYFSPASSVANVAALASTSSGDHDPPIDNNNHEFATISFLIPLSIPLDPTTLASLSLSTSPTSPPTPPTSPHLPVAVLVDHLIAPHAPATLADVRVSHWLPEPWVARLADTPVKFPPYAYQSAPLVDYLAGVADVVGRAVKVAASSGAVRKEVVKVLARAFAECLIEADTHTYSTLAVVIDTTLPTSPTSSASSSSSSFSSSAAAAAAADMHPVLATLVFPERFPTDPPVLILRAPTLFTAATPTSSTLSSGSSGSASLGVARSSVPEYTTRPKLWNVLRGTGTGTGTGGAWADLAARLRGWVVEEAGGWTARVGGK